VQQSQLLQKITKRLANQSLILPAPSGLTRRLPSMDFEGERM